MLDATPIADSYTLVEDQVLVADRRITAATTAGNFTPLQQLSRFSYTDTALGLKFSPQARVVAVLSYSKITILDSTSGKVVSTATPFNSFTDLDFTADGRYLFVADNGGGGFGIPIGLSYIHRYDTLTNTWQSKTAAGQLAYQIEAVDSTHVLLKEQSQTTAIMFYDFGATSSDPTTLLTKRENASYNGNFEYDYRTGKIFLGSTGLSVVGANYFVLTGNTIANGQYGPNKTVGDNSHVLSDDGKYFYFGRYQYDTANFSTEYRTYAFPVVGATGNLAFTHETSNTGIYNAITGVSLGTLGVVATYFADNDVAGNSLWVYSGTTKEIIQFSAPGANPGLLDNDISVPVGSTLSVSTPPTHGQVVLNQDGTFRFTPTANYNGTDSFIYNITDPLGNITSATVSLNILAVNDPPVAGLDSYQVDEDQTLTVNASMGLLANDLDFDGNTLTITANTNPTKGTVTVLADGSFVYIPNANANGDDTFSYTLSDGTNSVTGTVAITVRPIADPPNAIPNSYSMNEDTTLAASSVRNVLSNDFDPDGATTLTAILVTPPAVGVFTLNSVGTFSYAPPANYNGTVSFVYQASDGALLSAPTTATILVIPVNDAPTPIADAYQVDEDQVLTVAAASGVLVNDFDIDSASLSLTVIARTNPPNGSVSIAADGSFIYTPKPNFFGIDTFTYTVSDGNKSSLGTVTITVIGTPDAPTASDDNFSVNEDTTLAVNAARNVLTNDSNLDATGNFTAVLVSPPSSGTLTLNPAGTFSYVPAANFNGSVTFTYQAYDGNFLSNVVTATITVVAVNDAPSATADTYTLPWAAPSLTISSTEGLLANDSDIDGDAITAVLVTAPASGSVTLNADGSFTYTKGASFGITDSFIYRTRDSAGLFSASRTVTINLDTGRIVLGTTTLVANTPNQQIPIFITGNAPLNGFNFRIQLGDGLNGSAEPIVSNIDFTNSIWSGAGSTQILGGPVTGAQQFVQASIVFNDAQAGVISSGRLATLVVDTTGIYGGNFAFNMKGTQIGEDSDLITVGASESSPLFITNGTIIVTPATITMRQTFYNNSYFDDQNPAINASDLNAVDPGKVALLPQQTAKFQNYTSYSKGINGIIIEVQNYQYLPTTTDEFEFRVGNTTSPGTWTQLSVQPTMLVQTLPDGKARISLTWPDGTIVNKWLEVTIKAKQALGLPLDDVFYFGNAVGETGNQPANTFVDGTDFTYTRDNTHNFLNRAAINDPADFNRDSLVDGTDLGLTRDSTTNFLSALKLFTPPAHTTPTRTPYVPPSPPPSLRFVANPLAESQSTTALSIPLSSESIVPKKTQESVPSSTNLTRVQTETPNLSAAYSHIALNQESSYFDEICDDLFRTMRKKRV